MQTKISLFKSIKSKGKGSTSLKEAKCQPDSVPGLTLKLKTRANAEALN